MEPKKIDEFTWKIEKKGDMEVPAIFYASDKLMEQIKKDKTLEQAQNVACLKGIQNASYTMPDAHQGYGFPIGGVAAFDMEEGVISPGGVGYDICCSVRLIRTDFTPEQIIEKRKELLNVLFNAVPAGLGSKGQYRATRENFHEVIEKGAKWAVKEGFGKKEDYERTEEEGCMPKSDFSAISDQAIKRGLPQLGSLGSGNHFLEIQKVDKIYDPEIAKRFGFDKEGQVAIMVHCGSRGLGHQVASDYIKKMEQKYGHEKLPDHQLINAPIQSELGQQYYKAMSGAANFAFANKQMITHWLRESIEKVLGTKEGLDVVYDVAHNIAKFEKHEVDGKMKELCVHRKGATRSFGPGREELPEVYRDVGQPVIIPGSMGTASYVLVGTKQAEQVSFGSTAHGAGRVMSRSQAIRSYNGDQIKEGLLKQKNIEVKGASLKGLAEEAPEAYKDIDEVIRVSEGAGIGKPVVRVVPIAVIKG